jgi:hypothetical protein
MMPIKDPEKKRASKKVHYEANKEQILARQAIYRAANREKANTRQAVYYEANRDQYLVRDRAYREANKEKIASKSAAHYQTNKEVIAAKHAAYDVANRDKVKVRRAVYYEANKEKVAASGAAWRETNKEKKRANDAAYHKASRGKRNARHGIRLQTDQNYAIVYRLRTRLRQALKGAGVKKSSKTFDLIGCTIQELVAHLESQFQPGMTWENRSEWHIDHIRPCASFDLSDPAQQRACFHWSNLQPLWAADNLAKGDKVA